MSRVTFFNNAAQSWDKQVTADPHKLAYIVSFLQPGPDKQVIDAGTGTGVLIPFLRQRLGPGAIIYAVDFAEKMLEQAKQKYSGPNIEFIHADIADLDFPEQSIDGIVCYSIYPHLENKLQVMQALVKVLKPGGKLIVAHADSREQINKIHRSIGGTIANDLLPPISETVALLTSLGLEIETQLDNQEYYLVVGRKKGAPH